MTDISPLNDSSIGNKLVRAWKHWKKNMITSEGRPLAEPDRADTDEDGNRSEPVTYSETVAYVMYYAFRMKDQKTFAKVWNWAKNNMQRKKIKHTYTCTDYRVYSPERGKCKKWDIDKKPVPEKLRDHLFAWRALPVGPNNEVAIINFKDPLGKKDYSGINAASDDLEIAALLYLAYLRKWGKGDEYYREARAIVKDAWEKYVVKVGNRYLFYAGDEFSWKGVINPSYFRPAYYRRILPVLDPEHPWHKLIPSSYQVITENVHPGVNLPRSWLGTSPDVDFVESRFFPGVLGRIFGRDAYRTLWAVAQDYGWWKSKEAKEYLTDCGVGPLCFLRKNLNPERFRPTAFHHDGSFIRSSRPDKNMVTWGLNKEQLSMYGAYFAYFHYAGDREMTQRILRRLNRAWNRRGYWGADRYDYFIQIWVPFGLMLANYGPPAELKKVPPAPVELEGKVVEIEHHKPAVTADPRLGTQRVEDNWRAKLKRELVVVNLDVEQLQETLAVVSTSPQKILGAEHVRMFKKLRKIDKKYPYKLIGYLADPREFWNNVVILLSVLSQKLIEKNLKDDLEKAITFCQEFRKRIDLQSRIFLPHSYSRMILDLTEAELRAQATDMNIDFYEEGIALAMAVMNHTLNTDPEKAAPDYYVIIKSLLVIGDLYLRMHETTVKHMNSTSNEYLDKASEFYNYVAQILGNKDEVEIRVKVDLSIKADAQELLLTISPSIIKSALDFNFEKGHISSWEELEDARDAVQRLKGVALAKDASLYIRRNGEKDIGITLQEIEKCNRAIENLESYSRNAKDFYVSYAKYTKADLLLALASQSTFYLWPENSRDLRSISTQLAELEKLFKLSAPENASKQAIINRIFKLNKHLVEQARLLYRSIPEDFDFLYAASRIKLTEIAVRNAEFMDREFRFLLPFYIHPVFTGQKPGVPDNEFLGILKNYLKALLLASSKRRENMRDALHLFNLVKSDARGLKHPYPAYFEVHADLKRAEIYAAMGYKRKAYKLFKKTLKKLNKLTKKDFRVLAWRPYSLLAELYQEMANTGRGPTKKYIKRALENCYRSDSRYDFKERRELILNRYIHYDWLEKFDEELQEKYGRRPK